MQVISLGVGLKRNIYFINNGLQVAHQPSGVQLLLRECRDPSLGVVRKRTTLPPQDDKVGWEGSGLPPLLGDKSGRGDRGCLFRCNFVGTDFEDSAVAVLVAAVGGDAVEGARLVGHKVSRGQGTVLRALELMKNGFVPASAGLRGQSKKNATAGDIASAALV